MHSGSDSKISSPALYSTSSNFKNIFKKRKIAIATGTSETLIKKKKIDKQKSYVQLKLAGFW